MTDYPAILGVFSLRRNEEVGTGATQARHDQLTYWYARQLSPDVVEIQPLNVYHVPSGIKKLCPLDEFLRSYTPEPRYYEANTVPALNSLRAKIDQGEKFFSMGLLDDAEKAFLKALMIDEMSVPANYGLGDVYSEQKDFQKLRRVLTVLMGLDDAFSVEYRQKLNTFGVNLRKQGFFDESIAFFNKALELRKDDENIYFNLARVHFDKGEIEKCIGILNIATTLNPEFVEARKFMRYCERMTTQ
ncbi:Lipopolysaccharide assembly protein B [Fundidesulfovibrio magnetotacticus]|uniref:Lipopolysaccharide assembly protein B n=1 Tax=Fundidesulfovibrio magnetotacticus TaxID=2730080 RepID=A0A6V8M057_9BACT|nr:tetratricopeptide repeat protein [Fundidesulfovibrio magnetotacticus]GFK95416.1 Lipopolysaccharide assembly protein B [Fundidesulfovibrio magnetotacticus]